VRGEWGRQGKPTTKLDWCSDVKAPLLDKGKKAHAYRKKNLCMNVAPHATEAEGGKRAKKKFQRGSSSVGKDPRIGRNSAKPRKEKPKRIEGKGVLEGKLSTGKGVAGKRRGETPPGLTSLYGGDGTKMGYHLQKEKYKGLKKGG